MKKAKIFSIQLDATQGSNVTVWFLIIIRYVKDHQNYQLKNTLLDWLNEVQTMGGQFLKIV